MISLLIELGKYLKMQRRENFKFIKGFLQNQIAVKKLQHEFVLFFQGDETK